MLGDEESFWAAASPLPKNIPLFFPQGANAADGQSDIYMEGGDF